MKGYKGIGYRNGILRSKYNSIFEVGIPTPHMEIDSGIGFSESGYSYCKTIEDVIYWEHFIQIDSSALREIRLFEIESVGDYTGTGDHYKAESIIVKREVPQAEILEYLLYNLAAFKVVLSEVGMETFKKYKSRTIIEYTREIEEEKIKRIYVNSCLRKNQKGLCLQESYSSSDLKLCENCAGKEWGGSLKSNEHDYWYLLSRAKLLQGYSLNSIEYYKKLKEDIKRKNEYEMLELIEGYLHN
ncbi:hypothetical protein CJF15_02015 [Clostridium botulinum]|uniref:hypothetical protein n=1 Tax=Clostridium botulinum TaxID=1491 RepID=UPI001969B431|nr:hypothetical protein [Clostridium botulinum]MBN3407949.1 hypothetical protein [Clostridium botulinum]MBY6872512.1 hypothetical protein [Clostridium botulinum]